MRFVGTRNTKSKKARSGGDSKVAIVYLSNNEKFEDMSVNV